MSLRCRCLTHRQRTRSSLFLHALHRKSFQGDVGKYPIVSIAIWHDNRTWKVHHFTADNQIAEREKQYDIAERSTVGEVGRDRKLEN